MTFVSYEFAVFAAVCLGLYWGINAVLGRTDSEPASSAGYGSLSGSIRICLLFLFSAAFLILAGGIYSLAWYGVSALSVWAGALAIERERKSGRDRGQTGNQNGKQGQNEKQSQSTNLNQNQNMAGWIYGCILAFNLIHLAVFRYSNFPGYTLQELCWLMGREWEWEPFSLVAPVAVSFYTLTLIGYLTEVYWESVPAEKSYLRLALFGGFFPQMAMGPVARYQKLSRTLFSDQPSMTGEEFTGAFLQILWGLFQKLVISERLAIIVNTIYDDPVTYSGSYLVFAAACFGFQLYTDFGGAIEIALGVARLFGVRLEPNFCQPFFSRSVAEFWRRWHMTLGGWFKDFVMYPLLKSGSFQKLGRMARKHLGKNTGKKIPTAAGLFGVWFLLGLWHGGKWTFIIGSGLYHALLMSLSLFTEPLTTGFFKKTGLNPDHILWATFQRIRIFVLVSVGFVFFRSDSLAEAVGIFRGMFSGNLKLFSQEGLLALELPIRDLVLLAGSMLLLFGVSIVKERAWQAQNQKAPASGLTDEKKDGPEIRTEDAHREIGTGQEELEKERGNALESSPVFWKNVRRLAAGLCLVYVVLIFGWYGRGYDPAAFIYSQF